MKFQTDLEYRSKPVSSMGILSIFALILFCFLLSTSLDFQQGFKTTLPQSNTATLNATDKLAVVIVSHDGKYLPYFNNKAVKWENLEEELVEIIQNKSIPVENGIRRPILSLRADKSIPYEYIIRVLDIVRHMKIEVNLVTDPIETPSVQ